MPHLQMHAEGARDLVFHRHFNAPPERLYTRFTEPRWLRRWLDDPGQPMHEVVFEAWPGGRIRFRWQGPDGSVEMTGLVLETAPPRLVRHSERFTPDWLEGSADVIKRFDPEGHGTLLSIRVIYPRRSVRDEVMDTNLAEGMERHFVKLDQMLGP